MKILTIENKAAKVRLDDQVDEYSRKQLMAEIAKTYGCANIGNVAEFGEITNAVDNAIDTLEIEINSPGGSVFDGYLIFNEIKALRARGVVVTATINPLAASMGSVIAMAADTVRIVPNGTMMIHDAQMFTGGNAKQLSKMAKVLDDISNEIAGIYAAKTGKTVDEMRALMLDETWLTADESVALGLADAIFDIGAASNTLPPMKLLDRLTNPAADEAVAEITALKNQLASIETDHATELADMTAKLDTANAALEDAMAWKVARDEATAKVEALEAAVVTHAAALKAAEESAASKAIEIAAAAGITAPLEIEGGDTAPSDHITAMSKMNPVERAKYFRANKKAIMADMQKTSTLTTI
jgi:ATP-dependent protease ClpP protease subunit